MLNATASVYRWLLALLHVFGRQHRHASDYKVDDATRQAAGVAATFAPVDRRATLLGEAYRGVGVLVALLGAAAVFLALAPPALQMNEKWAHIIEIVVLTLIGILVFWARHSDGKGRWIRTRLLAEELRYEPLRLALQALEKDGVSSGVRKELDALLCGGPNCQISYNLSKHRRYERIESTVVRYTWLAFVFAAVCVAVSFLPAVSKNLKQVLLLGTAFVPFTALLLHSLVGFLRLPQLSTQHERTVLELQVFQKGLPAADADDELARALLLGTGNAVHELLRRGDTAWTGIAGMQEVHPA